MIILQILSVIFVFGLAKHDAPAVSNFHEKGVDNKSMSIFHRYNVWLKIAFCMEAARGYLPNWNEAIVAFIISGLWIYLLFDPILNVSRNPRFKWHYLGLNDKDGRTWNKFFGKHSGKIKAVILLACIIIVNLFFI